MRVIERILMRDALEAKQLPYRKNGTRKEVYDGIALQTKSGKTKENIYIDDNGNYKTKK